ncbi:hypothetical protein VOLCADRAFT_108369 [Volvox carteri f. nagariensis]|uniref:Protein TIC 20 n=1 Tax=Volvox carteri f. nagariensis TaxID=3068 RepID=D8UJR1_VOLCA|nr:uncharacterized protein VOLCADRAFT_108369 [Volvox carteri f. nagariensis]EFJ40036.1 hypothetical protein VOLCADRAFT_108369 [Volvox carteri f. nagariensis]|eukprot:XP_002958905.1 hypothetical protein VOLCADRAFT_108369 [Volvox carteri f. nagariensis]
MAALQPSTLSCSASGLHRATWGVGLGPCRIHVKQQVLGRRAAPSLDTAAPAESTSTRPVVVARSLFDNKNGDDFGDRIIAALPFLLPLLDGLPYAKFIMIQYPFVARAFAPVAPLMYIYHAFPFAPFLVFLAIYNGIVNNTSLPRFVRYHAMQAVLLDVLLIIPQVILNDVWKAPSDELGLQAYILAYNTLFLFTAVCSAYGMGSCLVGLTARLPLVAEAADYQVRDF